MYWRIMDLQLGIFSMADSQLIVELLFMANSNLNLDFGGSTFLPDARGDMLCYCLLVSA